METCVRGFSFMPENFTPATELKVVDSEELEVQWKVSRRQRLRQQEQKIYEEFVQEKDVVNSICKDDPYQFIEQLSEERIKELLEIELERMKKEKLEEEQAVEAENLSPKNEPVEESEEAGKEAKDNQHVVFMEESEKEDFHLCDDGRDGDVSGISEPEDELLNDSLSPPCTVRERMSPEPDSRNISPDKVSSTKSSENVTCMIESSIYCAKVKELRNKIAEELEEIGLSLERQNIINIDPADVPKMMKRAVEFTARFNRIHMYQLQRQMADIKRNAAQALPFARRTQFQSQLVRVASLHHNALHSLQVFIKSFPQTLCIRESGELLKNLITTLDEMTSTCEEVDAPPSLNAAKDLYKDNLPKTAEKLRTTLEDYTTKLSDYLNSTENTSVSCSHPSRKSRRGTKISSSWSKSGTNKSFGDTEAHLSMYSLDTLRTSKVPSSKGNTGGTSKKRVSLSDRSKVSTEKGTAHPKRKKSPRSRRPLMRDPQAGVPKPKRKTDKDLDVPTMVETVAPCSSHMSREPSLGRSPTLKDIISKKGKDSPRSPKKEPKRLRKEKTPRKKSPKKPLSPGRNSATEKEEIKTDVEKEIKEEKVQEPEAKEEIPIEILPKKDASTTKDATTIKEVISPRRGVAKNNSLTPRRDRETPRNANTPRQETKIKEPVSPEMLKVPNSTPRNIQDDCGEGERVPKDTPRKEEKKTDKRMSNVASCEVMTLLRQLCGGDAAGNKSERVSGAKNAQLVCMNGSSPRQPSTPQLLRILEETIQKKSPRPQYPTRSPRDIEKCRMTFNIPESISEQLYQYRTKFVQHMLTSSMYANSAVGKPWEVIGRVSERIIDELLLSCAKEMELQHVVGELYKSEIS